MTAADTPLTLAECRRCGDVILAGRADGMLWRLERRTVPRRHAAVLRRYGVPVLIIDRRIAGGLWGQVWHPPGHDLTTPRRYLAVPHVCGSVHARRQED